MELEIIKAIAEGRGSLALATIIDVKGSSPRHPGSSMLLGPEVGQLGTVGGGRGEARAIQDCRTALETRRPSRLHVEMVGTDITGPAMVCGGTNTMLIEPVEDPEPYRLAQARLARGERVVFVKRILPASAERPLEVTLSLVDQRGVAVFGTLDGAEQAAAARALDTGRPHLEEEAGVFYDAVFPREQLLILGAGHVGQALAAAAPALGFQVTVVDDRPEFLAPERFPDGVRTVRDGFTAAIAAFPFDAATYAVVVSGGHLLDLECMRGVLRREYRYAGFMGSARKARFLIDQLLQDGFDPARVAALWGPIGLDIGAETPAELASAILCEMIAVRRQARVLPDLQRATAARRA